MLGAVALGLAGALMLGTGLRRHDADDVFLSILLICAAIADAARVLG